MFDYHTFKSNAFNDVHRFFYFDDIVSVVIRTKVVHCINGTNFRVKSYYCIPFDLFFTILFYAILDVFFNKRLQ